jgi:hypothetical protein
LKHLFQEKQQVLLKESTKYGENPEFSPKESKDLGPAGFIILAVFYNSARKRYNY